MKTSIALAVALLLASLIPAQGADPEPKVFHDLSVKIGKKTADKVFEIPVPKSRFQNCSDTGTTYEYRVTGTLTVDTSVIGEGLPPKVTVSGLDRRIKGKLEAKRQATLRVKLAIKAKPEKEKTKPPVYEWVFEGFTLKVEKANCK